MKTPLLDKIAGKVPGIPDGTGSRNPDGRGMGPGQGTQSGLGLIQQKLGRGEKLTEEEQAIWNKHNA